MPDKPLNQDAHVERAPKRSLWPWFVVGFLIVFVGMSAVVTMYPMDPSGRAVVECKLWEYYLIEFLQALRPSDGVSPRGSSGVSTTALQHILCSLAGGAGLLGVAWGIRTIKGHKCRRD